MEALQLLSSISHRRQEKHEMALQMFLEQSPLDEFGINGSELRRHVFMLDEFNVLDVKVVCQVRLEDALNKRRQSRQTLNASVLFPVFTLDVKVV